MSPINSALQYKIQKMEKQLSSLMEENRALKNIINEANVDGMSTTAAFNYGGGAALGQNLASQPQVGVGGMGKVGSMSPTSTTTGGGNNPITARSANNFDGAAFGQLLAVLEGMSPQQVQDLLNWHFGARYNGMYRIDTPIQSNETSDRRRR